MRTLTFSGNTSRIALGDGGTLPEQIPLNPFGDFVGNGISLRFDAASLEAVLAQLKAKGVPFVLDLHHATVKVEEGEVSEAPAMGWISGLEVRDGFVYGQVQWTDLGAQKLAGGAYGFVSPVLVYDEATGQVMGYHSFALTNRPGTFNQRRIGLEGVSAPKFAKGDRVKVKGTPHMKGQSTGTVALVETTNVYGIKFDGMDMVHKWYVEDELLAGPAAGAAKPGGESKMPMQQNMKMKMDGMGDTEPPETAWEEMMEWLKKLLGLTDTATDDEVKAALTVLQAKAELGGLVMGALELSEPALTPETRRRVIALAANEGVGEELRKLRAQLEADRAGREADKVTSLIQTALEDGRILEPEKARWERLARLDLEGTTAALEGLLRRVPTQLLQVDRGGAQVALSESDLYVANILGISQEKLRKYGGEN